LEKVKESIRILIDSTIEYEFRTTVVSPFLNEEDIKQICYSLKGCKKYVLQNFIVPIGSTILNKNLSKSVKKEEMQKLLTAAKQIIPNSKIR
jgi:pyruvate formate lyase activating enzyme